MSRSRRRGGRRRTAAAARPVAGGPEGKPPEPPASLAPHAAQFRSPTGERIVDLVVGLDFGTAFTKVVLRSPFEFNDRAYAVPFRKHAPQSAHYLVASQIDVGADGVVVLREGSDSAGGANIKWRLLSERAAERLEAAAEAAAFLASVLREVRLWFLRTQRAGYGGATLRWALQIGVPSETYDDRTKEELFARVGRAAWLLSTTPGPVTLDRAAEALACVDDGIASGAAPLADFAVIPEVAAEVVGYARSDLRRPGLHFLVDAGASTLDVAGFILHESSDGDDLYPILSASVRPRGTLALQRLRCNALAKLAAEPMLALPRRFDEWVHSEPGVQAGLREVDEAFLRECHVQIGEVVRAVRRTRDPNAAAWREGVPVFLCGGGRAADFVYATAIRRLDAGLAKGIADWPGLRILRLDRPGGERLVAPGLPSAQYHRLAVAWGLSIPQDDIGKPIRPTEIPDIVTSPKMAKLADFVGPDQV